jgi:hypothetical protein
MGLSGNEKFDEAMQDRMASKLIADEGPRALQRWEALKKGGRMSTAMGLLRSGQIASQPGADGPGSVGSGDAAGIALGMQGARAGQASQALRHVMTTGLWCADFMNGVIGKAGGRGTGSAAASSFASWGKAVAIGAAKRGDVILENSGPGTRIHHVGMATGNVRRDANGNVTAVEMISGNYGNKVTKNWERTGIIAGMRRGDVGEAERRAAERAVLPRRSEAATPERHAGGVDFDTSSLREGIDHIRTFKAELSSLKGGVRVAIDHTHTHKGEPGGRPGALRTSLNGGYASDGRSWT